MKADVITMEDVKQVMMEVQKQVSSTFPRNPTQEQVEALSCFFATLWSIITQMFTWLPPEEIKTVMINCGTWFAIGMLFGKSPELLVEILEKVKPAIEKKEMPDWLVAMLEEFRKYGR
jgi:hypothetical protein